MNTQISSPRLGILGGGQLARMTIQAAIPLGVDLAILAEAADSPAGRLTAREIVGAWSDTTALRAFAEAVDVVTLENEFVDAPILEQLARWGKIVLPGANTLRTIQDKLTQKQALAACKLPVPQFVAVDSPEDIVRAAERFGWPLILKARRNGYDGYGNAKLDSAADIEGALQRLGWPERSLMVEQAVPFVRELAVLVARDPQGRSVTYPVVETVQQNHICHIVRAPAPIDSAAAEQATALACAAVEAVGGVGITAVEMFQTGDGQILINELAPRPHNSGHFSIDACYASQFENHVRAVLHLPLGNPGLRAPAAVMVNLLGRRNGPTEPRGLDRALADPDVHVHLYGKRDVRRGRKMGHITALGSSLAEAEQRALAAAEAIEL
ncbi:MAG TPA: 5-(carboxyamino)imidazole ribonucleotide synthase [Herpetosiphonaceae bacterium]